MLRFAIAGLLAVAPLSKPSATSPPPVKQASPPSTTATSNDESDPTPLSFAADVAPVLQKHCIRCHNDDDTSGGLRLDSYEWAMRGGDRGPAIVARNPSQSVLFQKVIRKDRPSMPPRKVLPAAEVKIIRTWIQTGARR